MYEIIEAFEEENGKYVTALEKGINAQDREAIEQVIASIIRISSNFGVLEIKETADAISNSVSENNYGHARDKIKILAAQLNCLEKNLSRLDRDMIHQ